MHPLEFCLQYLPCLEQGLFETGVTIFLDGFLGIYGANPNDGFVHPQKEIIGESNADAMCIIPVSLESTSLLSFIR